MELHFQIGHPQSIHGHLLVGRWWNFRGFLHGQVWWIWFGWSLWLLWSAQKDSQLSLVQFFDIFESKAMVRIIAMTWCFTLREGLYVVSPCSSWTYLALSSIHPSSRGCTTGGHVFVAKLQERWRWRLQGAEAWWSTDGLRWSLKFPWIFSEFSMSRPVGGQLNRNLPQKQPLQENLSVKRATRFGSVLICIQQDCAESDQRITRQQLFSYSECSIWCFFKRKNSKHHPKQITLCCSKWGTEGVLGCFFW